MSHIHKGVASYTANYQLLSAANTFFVVS